jgi:hypothetical protein
MSRKIRAAQVVTPAPVLLDALVLMDSGSSDRSIDRYAWNASAQRFEWAEVVATRAAESWEPSIPTWRAVDPPYEPWAWAYPVPDAAGYELGAFLEVYCSGDHEGEGEPSRVILWGPETDPIITTMEHSAALPWRLAGIPFVAGYWWAMLHIPPDVAVSELLPEFSSLPANATCFQVVRYDPDFSNATVAYQHYEVSARGWPATYGWASRIAQLYRDDEASVFASGTNPNRFIVYDLGLSGSAAIRSGDIVNDLTIRDPFMAGSDPDAVQPGIDITGTQSIRRAAQFFTWGQFPGSPMRIMEGFIDETGGDPELDQRVVYTPPTAGGWNANHPPPMRYSTEEGDIVEGGSWTDGAGTQFDANQMVGLGSELSRIEIVESSAAAGGPPETKRIRAAVGLSGSSA